jgi:hypothetical protein
MKNPQDARNTNAVKEKETVTCLRQMSGKQNVSKRRMIVLSQDWLMCQVSRKRIENTLTKLKHQNHSWIFTTQSHADT